MGPKIFETDSCNIPEEPEGMEVHWHLETDEITLEEMLENDLIVEHPEYLSNNPEK